MLITHIGFFNWGFTPPIYGESPMQLRGPIRSDKYKSTVGEQFFKLLPGVSKLFTISKFDFVRMKI